jgi:hypothetical protein
LTLRLNTDERALLRESGRGYSQNRAAALATIHAGVHRFPRRKDSGTVSFSIDDGAETDATATFPTAVLVAFLTIRSSATKTFDLDAFQLTITGMAGSDGTPGVRCSVGAAYENAAPRIKVRSGAVRRKRIPVWNAGMTTA